MRTGDREKDGGYRDKARIGRFKPSQTTKTRCSFISAAPCFLSLRIMLFSFAPPRRYPTRGRRCTARSLCRWHLRGWHSKTRGLRHLKNSSPCEGLCQSPRGPFHRLRRVWLLRAASIPVHSKSLILPDPARQPRCTFRAEAVGWVVNLSVMPL